MTEPEKQTIDTPGHTTPAKRNSLLSNGVNGSPPALPEKPLHRTEVQKTENTGTQIKDSVPATGVIVCLSPESTFITVSFVSESTSVLFYHSFGSSYICVLCLAMSLQCKQNVLSAVCFRLSWISCSRTAGSLQSSGKNSVISLPDYRGSYRALRSTGTR